MEVGHHPVTAHPPTRMDASRSPATDWAPDPVAPGLGDVAELLTRRIRALDLSCGDGHDALFLAARGIDVTALDSSAARVERLQREAQARGIRIDARVQSLAQLQLSGRYDLVLARACLHPLPHAQRARLVATMQAHTRHRGFNVVEVATAAHAGGDGVPDGEIFAAYAGWRILVRQSFSEESRSPANAGAWIGVNRLVAQKA
jgi:SAM-dependent methyltransferase